MKLFPHKAISLDKFGKIEDLEQLESWLNTQDQRMTRVIAARAALRSLPVALARADLSLEVKVHSLRTLLISVLLGTKTILDGKEFQKIALKLAFSKHAQSMTTDQLIVPNLPPLMGLPTPLLMDTPAMQETQFPTARLTKCVKAQL